MSAGDLPRVPKRLDVACFLPSPCRTLLRLSNQRHSRCHSEHRSAFLCKKKKQGMFSLVTCDVMAHRYNEEPELVDGEWNYDSDDHVDHEGGVLFIQILPKPTFERNRSVIFLCTLIWGYYAEFWLLWRSLKTLAGNHGDQKKRTMWRLKKVGRADFEQSGRVAAGSFFYLRPIRDVEVLVRRNPRR